MLNLLLKPYIKYKLNDILQEEIKATKDPTYTSPYFKSELWNSAAWEIHRQVKKAYDEIIEKVHQTIDDMDLTSEEREKAYNLFTFIPSLDDEGKVCINIKTLQD